VARSSVLGQLNHSSLRRVVIGLAASAVVALVLTGARPDAHAVPAADQASGERHVRSGDGWLSAWTGVSFGDTVVLGNGSGAASLAGRSEAPVFGIDAYYRTSRLDLGLLFEALGSSRFTGLAGDNRIGSHFRVAASLRWRYLDAPWGALFVRLSPGLSVLGHSDALRAEVVGVTGGDATDFARADEFSLGFSLGLDAGALIYLSDRLALSLQVDVLTNTASVGAPGGSVAYAGFRGLFTVGLEWRM